MTKKEEPKYKHIISNVNNLSLGISVVVAILLGVGIGVLLKNFFDATWLLFLGLFWGIAAAFLNVYRAYKTHQKEFEEFENTQSDVEFAIKKDNQEKDK